MRAHGFCRSCRRVKLVRVGAAGMARIARGVEGVCDECEEKADKPFSIVADQGRRGRVTVLPRHRTLRAAVQSAARLAAGRGVDGELLIEEHRTFYPFGVVRTFDADGRPAEGRRR